MSELDLYMSRNENPMGPSPLALKAVMDRGHTMNLYPEPHAQTIKNKLSLHLNLPANRIFVSAGSVEALDILIRNFIQKNEHLIIPKVTFIAYKLLANVFKVTVRYAAMNGFGINVDDIMIQCDHKTKMIILANPNNPTGMMISHTELLKILDYVEDETLVVVDEAYCEYVTDTSYPDTLKLLGQYENLIVLRTFSKIYGLAGLRVGYAMASEQMVKQMEYFQAPFTVNRLASIASQAALDDTQFVQESIEMNAHSRRELSDNLRKLGFHVADSQSNFLFVHFDRSTDRDRVVNTLKNAQLHVALTDYYGDEKAFRLTIPKQNHCNRIIDILKRH